MSIKENRSDLTRMNEIARVLLKYGFESLVQRLGIGHLKFIPKARKLDDDFTGDDINIRIRLVFQELGTTFIKLGQTLSTYPNLVGFPLADELSKLQESAPITSYDIVTDIIEGEFSKDIHDIFDDFSHEPIASASIGQVHKAFLNNKQVAIKVQHPDIEERIKSDIRIIKILVNRLSNLEIAKTYNFSGFINLFEKDMQRELDYTFEAMNMVHLGGLLSEDEVYIPKVFLDYTTKKILVMEFIEGVSLRKVLNSNDDEYDKRNIALVGVDTFFKQILIHGFFHADPHAGNLFIINKKDLALIDFGMMGHISDDLRMNVASLFLFISQGDAKLVTRQLAFMDILTTKDNYDEIEYEIMDIFDKYYDNLFDNVTNIFREIISNKTLTKYGLVIPRDLMMILRTISMIADIGLILDPTLNITDVIKPYVYEIITDRLKPRNALGNATQKYLEMHNLYRKIPESLDNLTDVIDDGRINLAIEAIDLSKIMKDLTTIFNQITLAIITAALIVGSSLVMLLDTGWKIFGYPAIGLTGFLASALFGFIVIILILKKNNF